MESVSLSAEKGCPFCNFSVCQGNACLFFGRISNTESDCILLASFWLTAATYGNVAWMRATSADSNPHLSGLDLRPEVLQQKVDATRQALEVLTAIEKDTHMPPETHAEISRTRASLVKYVEALKSDIETGEKLCRPHARRKKKE